MIAQHSKPRDKRSGDGSMPQSTTRQVRVVAPEKIYEKLSDQHDSLFILERLRTGMTDYAQLLGKLESDFGPLSDQEKLELINSADAEIVCTYIEELNEKIKIAQSNAEKFKQGKKARDQKIREKNQEIIEKSEKIRNLQTDLNVKEEIIKDAENIAKDPINLELMGKTSKSWRMLGFKVLADWLDYLSEQLEKIRNLEIELNDLQTDLNVKERVIKDSENIAENREDISLMRQTSKGWRMLGFKVLADWLDYLSEQLDYLSEQVKKIGNLENSRTELRRWNDIYRIQQTWVLELVKKENGNQELIKMLKKIYGLRSVENCITYAVNFLDIERSETIRLLGKLKNAKKIKYIKIPEE